MNFDNVLLFFLNVAACLLIERHAAVSAALLSLCLGVLGSATFWTGSYYPWVILDQVHSTFV